MTEDKAYPARDAYLEQSIAAQYDSRRFSSILGRVRHRLENRLLARSLSDADLSAGQPVCDVPCGTGRFLPFLSIRGLAVKGFDVSPAMLKVAGERMDAVGLPVELEVSDAAGLPLTAGGVEAVVSFRFMNHLPPPVRGDILSEFSRVSRRWLIVSFTHRYSLQRLLRWRSRRRKNDVQHHVSRREARLALQASGWRLRKARFLLPGISETFVCLAEKEGSTAN